jgi:cholesterol oxidase
MLACMMHDSASGEIVLGRDGAPRVEWPSAPEESIYARAAALLRPGVEALGGAFVTSPRMDKRLGRNLLSGHPLGGCAAGNTVEDGVVDHAGHVFAADGGLHDGLFVCDGSVFPRGIGVNPSLTISMFAERAADLLRAELGLPAFQASDEADDRALGIRAVPNPAL